MKWFIPTAITALLVPAASVLAANTNVMVGYNGINKFYSDKVNITVGDSVTWTWNSGVHSVFQGVAAFSCNRQPNGFASPTLRSAGETFTQTFNTAGTFWYFSSVGNDCKEQMLGVVYVNNKLNGTSTSNNNATASPAVNTTIPDNSHSSATATKQPIYATTMWLVGSAIAASALLL